jgi:outer membrane protein TolC
MLLICTAGCAAPSPAPQPPVVAPAHEDRAVRTPADAGVNPEIQRVGYQQVEARPGAPAGRENGRYPIDLATTFRLAGANNIQIALAAERVQQARARLQGANALWLPSLTGGVGYSQHDGQFQEAAGNVADLPRNSLFVGGGASLGTIGVAGASQQPRMTVGLPLADTLFTPLSERQNVQGAGAALTTTFNDTLLQVALAYLDLLQAQAQVAIAQEAVANARELDKLVDSNVRAGRAPPADGLRARAELADRRRLLQLAEEGVRVTSTELVRLLRLDPAVTLTPAEDQPVAVTFVETDNPLPPLIEQAFAHRPELVEQRAQLKAALVRLRQEQWRPLIPTVQLGYGGGGFGGGPGSSVTEMAGRDDFDAMLVWELRNLGLGNLALTRERASLNSQAELSVTQTGDRIAAEVARGYYQARQRKLQIGAARDQVKAAAEAVPLNFQGIRGGELRAIEAQQAIQALVYGRSQYLAAVIDYNRAQYSLLRAVGLPPDAPGLPAGPGG